MKALVAALVCAASLFMAQPAAAQGARNADLVRADLLAEPAQVGAGEPFWVGIRLRMKEHWHTYWQNPGDSGLPTEVKWTLPAGFSAGDLVWPTPERIPVGPLVNYGYEGETMLLARIVPPASLAPGASVGLKADVSYLVCERECIPGEAALSLDLPVTDKGSPTPEPPNRALFAAARARLPIPSPFPAHLDTSGETPVLRIEAPGLTADRIRSAYFFPFDDNAIQHAAPQKPVFDAGGLSLALTRNPLATGPMTEVGGVLALEEALDGGVTRTALAIGQPPVRPSAGTSTGTAAGAAVSVTALLNAALFAFLGGLLLNLMPCVFPVLSIKALSLVRQAGRSAAALRLNGLVYAAGVILTFLGLAAILLAVRAGGAEIGWGFQLQSPVVVAALAALLFAMGLSLSGVVAFGGRLGGIGDGLATRSGLSGSFFTGVLATLVATPCTAPFMGTAIGFALTAPASVALAIFVALGFGMALPFLLLTLAPGLIGRLPRPGPWMETLKQALAFPLYATVAWLVFVLAQQVGPAGLFAALIGLVLVAFALWALSLAGQRERGPRFAARGAALAALAGLVMVGFAIAGDHAGATVVRAAGIADTEPFTQARLDALQAHDKPVFVNLTAAWCVTCLVNERTALASPAVRDAMAARRITYLKGDWTNQNPEITRLLARNGRSGVPLYLLYPGRGEAIVLPQLLTEASLLEGLGRVAEPKPDRRADLRSDRR